MILTVLILAILSHTPMWVWPLLAFLIFRGLQATRTRQTPLWRALVLPLVMFGLSVFGLLQGLSAHALASALGALALLVGAWLGFHGPSTRRITVDVARQRLILPGSWQPLLLTLAVFALKYSAAVLLAMHPALATADWFTLPLAALYGAMAGLFAGRMLRIMHLYVRATAAAGRGAQAAG